MSGIILFCLGLAAIIVIGGIVNAARHQTMRQLASEDAAFDGEFDWYGLTPARTEQLRGLIDRVGVITVSLKEQKGGMAGHRLEELFEVFVIDVAGAVHEVAMVSRRDEAALLVTKVSETFDIPIEDPDRILPD